MDPWISIWICVYVVGVFRLEVFEFDNFKYYV